MIEQNEYLFSSSFLRAGEGVGTPAQRMMRMLEAQTPAQLYAAMAEMFRVSCAEETTVFDTALGDAVERVRGAVPDFTVFAPLLYKYDCTNIKTVLKCLVQNISAYDAFYTCGTVAAAEMQQAVNTGVFPTLPPAMGAAAEAARLEYGKTGEVRCIDLLLDQACYRDMADAAAAGGVELIQTVVTMRADFANILACLRIRASGVSHETGAALLTRAFVPGGQIGREQLLSAEHGCSTLPEIAQKIQDAYVKDAVRRAAGVSASDFLTVEKVFDDAVLRATEAYRYVPFGPEVIVRYLLLREAEVRNGRVVASRFAAGVDAETIRERLCDVNV